MLVYNVIRDVTPEECWWLEEPITKGSVVYEYTGHTYGCVTPGRKAYTKVYNETPFFELPNDAVDFDLTASD